MGRQAEVEGDHRRLLLAQRLQGALTFFCYNHMEILSECPFHLQADFFVVFND
jgi:hypothetical protein